MNIQHTFSRLRRLSARAMAIWPIGASCRCVICGRSVQRYLPYRGGWKDMPAVVTEQDMIGSDVENFECPACGCHDRERHLWLYLQASGLVGEWAGARILHLAPERRLSRFIGAAGPAEYVQGDLYPSHLGMRRVDLMDIDFPDGCFDLLLANHVLEHVEDDGRALREIFRVLRPGGKAILQTPFAGRLSHKLEDPSIRSEAARLAAYGQEDHCRLYGADFASHVASFGFVSRVSTHDALLPGIDVREAGVNPREPFLLFEKPAV